MTQELIFWILLVAMVGFVWIFTCAILTQGRSATPSIDEGLTQNQQEGHSESQSFSRKVAA